MRFLILLITFLIWSIWGATFAISTIAEKEAIYGDLVLESPALQYTAPNWFVPHNQATAPEDARYWIDQVFPMPQYRDEDLYLVIPGLGLVTPIVKIPPGSSDFNTMVSGGEIGINKYLNNGIIEYVNSVRPGHRGKRVDFGHSNFYKDKEGDFKSIFGNLMRMDVWDEFWYFERNASWGYDLFKYITTQSYNIDPYTWVSALSRDGSGADALVFGCTFGLEGRWMLHWEYIGEPVWAPFDPYANVDPNYRRQIDDAVTKISRLRTNSKKFAIVNMVKVLNKIRSQYNLRTVTTLEDYKALNGQEIIVQYIEDKLIEIYPE